MACGGRVTGQVRKWQSDSRRLAANGLGGGEDDGDPIFWGRRSMRGSEVSSR
jgi:hypothetical protein